MTGTHRRTRCLQQGVSEVFAAIAVLRQVHVHLSDSVPHEVHDLRVVQARANEIGAVRGDSSSTLTSGDFSTSRTFPVLKLLCIPLGAAGTYTMLYYTF